MFCLSFKSVKNTSTKLHSFSVWKFKHFFKLQLHCKCKCSIFSIFSFKKCIFKDTPCFCVGRGRQSPFLVCCIGSIHSKGSFRKLLPTKAPSMKATLAFFSKNSVRCSVACHCLILPQSRSSLWSSAAVSLTKSIDLLSVYSCDTVTLVTKTTFGGNRVQMLRFIKNFALKRYMFVGN